MSETTQEQKIGEFVLWLEAGNGNNLMQSVCSAIINQADEWYESKLIAMAELDKAKS